MVGSELERLGVKPTREDKDEYLGLALLTLPEENLEAAVAALSARSDEIAASMQRAKDERIALVPSLRANYPPLNDLMAGLRALYAHENAGWRPTMGKNRIIAPVTGSPYISGGGEGPPEQSDGLSARVTLRPGLGVRVGVLDTGLIEHPWLADAYVAAPGAKLPLKPPPPKGKAIPSAVVGHATFVAGLILQQAPGAQLEISQVLDEQAEGSVWEAAKAIAQFEGSGVDILNLSFACFTADGEAPLVLATAIDRLDSEIVVVAAAGNHGDPRLRPKDLPGLTPRTPAWPAALDDVVAVGAVDADGKRAWFSPSGPEGSPDHAPWVDHSEVGVHVQSTYLEGEVCAERLIKDPKTGKADTKKEKTAPFAPPWATWDGTSFAAATLSGRIAAGIRPGRVSAREALAQLLSS
ncbi:MAG TPA: S8 family serine peptidase [Actinomycetes bacterium]|nr:S8 family serine peptidase [Actinomycetes bacterium]